MRATVQKWGNSLALRIPKALAVEVGLRQGTQLEVAVEDGRLVARPSAVVPTLDELLARVTDENLHPEMALRGEVGREVVEW